MRAAWKKHLDTAIVASLVLALAVLGLLHKGVAAAEVELNDGGVWVTHGAKNLVAHLNYQSQTLDGGLRTATNEFDISQFGDNVLVGSPFVLQPLDPATVTFTGESAVADVDYAHGGDLVLFAAKGKVWSANAEGAGSFNPAAEPLLKDLEDPRIVVGTDGVGHVLTADGEVRSIEGSGGDAVVREVGRLDGELGGDPRLTVVGDHLVVLDGTTLKTLGGTVDLGTADAELQQPGGKSDEVLVATKDALLRVPLKAGDPKRTDVPVGRPARPVALAGCAYALWATSGYYVRDCADRTSEPARQYPELVAAVEPVFRVNRTSIVINDLVNGAVYLPEESMIRVDNWDLISADLEEKEEQESEESEETEQSQVQEFSEEQNPPVANDDELGARAGTATTLPILVNDLDVDGDVLTAVLKDVPSDISVALTKNGRAVRVEVPGGKTGTFSFTYQATDGVALSNVATVRVPITPTGSNEPPKRPRKNTLTLSERATVEYAVLPDWIDPDGDPLYLENAVGEEGLAVTWRPDGFISVRDLGTGGAGRKKVSLQVNDGTATTTEELTVQVTPRTSNTPPIANNDHYAANVGETITVRPLANDTDADGDELNLVEVGATAREVALKYDVESGTIQFTADKPGTQTIVYAISDGPSISKGKIRVDVTDPEKAAHKPAAENDLALLPPNGAVIVEPLRNDFDPAGGVMVIQGLSMGSSEGLNVEVVRHSLLRVTAPAGLTNPETFEYTVSNGAESATAKVTVIPLKVKSQIQAPVALPESTVVRAGDIVTLAVLDNDYSPSDLAISLIPELQVRSEAEIGEFFVAGDTVRFRAGAVAGQAEATYTIEDEEGNVASSTATVTVKEFDERNQQPIPRAVEARTFAGMEVRIPIPMDGIDPDGDSVELSGASGARLGSVTVEGNYLTYAAGREGAGTDTFEYRVKDRFGAEGVGMVRVGVAPRPSSNQAPVAVPDEVAARPGTRLEVPVTANDVDPDGDEITLVAGSVEAITKGWDPKTELDGQKVIVVTPEEKGVYQFYYAITDGGGAPVKGVATILVDENVPPRPPVAYDDYVTVGSVAGLDKVEVAVLDNDFDPDGTVDALAVSVDEGEQATADGGVVTVPLTDERQVILYTVTDADGLSARAAVIVPGKDQIPPYLDPAKIPAVVKGGDTLVVDFDEYIVTREGHRAQLTAVETVVAGKGGDTKDKDLGLKVGERSIEFTPDVLFIGTTSISFEVTDGSTLDDPRGLVQTLSLPITVESSGLFPPELRPSPIQVAPGEQPIAVSLAAMVDDPDPGDNEKMKFTVKSAGAPFDVDVSGQTAKVSVPADAKVGTSGSLVLTVHDGTTDPQDMTVPLSVIRSTRPLMSVTDISEDNGRVNQPLTWNLNDYVTNPFADRGEEITLVGQPTVTGPATASASGMTLTVTPTDSGSAGDAAEQVVVTYTVADATKDSSRYRTGTARITVKDTPKAPVDVAAEYLKSKTVRVTWSHSGWRGGSRDGFVVSWNGGTKDCGLVTKCVIDTLPNNNTYTFTVTARVKESDIPDSPPSAPSRAVFVDVAPNPPVAPTTAFGDQAVDLTWAATTVPDGGSPVSKYTVDISPPDAKGRTQQDVTGTSFTWSGLKNGTAYTFKLRAHNKQTDTGEVDPPVGPASAPVIPAGAPSNQGAPHVVKDRAAAGVKPRATVSWGPPGNPNGDSSFTYEMRQTGSGELRYSGGSTSSVVSMDVSTEDRTFEVRSTNKSGKWSEWSPVSNRVRAFQPPSAPGGFALSPTGVSNQAKFSFTAADGNGAKASEISYRWSAGGSSGTVSSGDTVTSGAFANGSTVSVTLTAISTVDGETATGGSTTATVNAYGPPSAPSVSASGSANNVSQSWSMPGNSNGRPISTVQLDPGGNAGLSGSRTQGNGRNQQHCIRARSQNSEGQWSPWSGQACASTWANPYAFDYRGAQTNSCGQLASPCNKLMLTLERWNPGSTVTCTFSAVGTSDGTQSMSVRVDGNGYWNGQFRNWVVGSGISFGDVTSSCRY